MSQRREQRRRDNDRRSDINDDDDANEKEFYEFLAQQAALLSDQQQQQQELRGSSSSSNVAGTSSDAAESTFHTQTYATDEEMVRQTYRELCYDQPRLDPTLASRGCRLLSDALLKPAKGQQQQQGHYALSESFVDGLLQALSRIDRSPTRTANATGAGPCSTTATAPAPSSVSPTGLSILAWTVFGRIPNSIICRRVKTLEEANRLVGSYHGGKDGGITGAVGDGAVPPSDPGGDGDEVAAAGGDTAAIGDQHQRPGQEEKNDVAVHIGNGNAPDPPPPGDDLAEVWAEESDPSDYGYDDDDGGDEGGSGVGSYDAFANLQRSWVESLQQRVDDAEEAGNRSSNNLPGSAASSWKAVAGAVTNLLRECRYNQLSPALFVDKKWRTEIVDTATQLALALLLVEEVPDQFACREFEEAYGKTHWQQLALIPIHLLRDAAAEQEHHPTAMSCLSDYLRLLQTMIQVQRHVGDDVSAMPASNPARRISTAVWVGMSLLSNVCSQMLALVEQQRHGTFKVEPHTSERIGTVRRAVLELADDLSLLLEHACRIRGPADYIRCPGNTDNSANQEGEDEALLDALPWNCLSFIRILTVSTSTLKTFSGMLQSSDAQILLNSGLFRQWLLLWQQQRKESTSTSCMDETSSVLPYLQRSILALCMASPTLLGKYAWRYPGFAAAVTDVADAEGKEAKALASLSTAAIVDAFLWNLLGIRLAAGSATTSSAVQWKKTPAKASNGALPQAQAPPSVQQCRQQASRCYQNLLQKIIDVTSEFKEQMEKQREQDEMVSSHLTISSDQKNAALSKYKDGLNSFQRFTQQLTTTQLLMELFVSELLVESSNLSLVAELQELLAHWPVSDHVSDKVNVKTEEESDLSSAKKKCYIEDDVIVDGLRRSVKVLKTLIESEANNTDATTAGVTGRSVSSKVD